MNLINTVKGVQEMITSLRNEGKSIGFVPSMGALHEGHLSLVKQCISDNDICVVSIFVNPTQFNNTEDLVKYPRNLEKDCLYLEKAGVDIVFAPSVEEIYPQPDTRQFDFDQLDKVMEGEHRPGHFNGVAQVVSRLFDIIKPDMAYFGEKDFQQLAIIREMVKQLELNVQIIPMPIVRETSGLALSSRNERLNAKQRLDAVKISEVLLSLSKNRKKYSVDELQKILVEKINAVESLKVEYFDIVDGYSLQSIRHWSDTKYAVGCIAVFCGDVRLIDNVTYYIQN